MKKIKEEKKDRKIVRRQIYTIEVVRYDDGNYSMKRINDGFGALELLGAIEYSRSEIVDIIAERLPKPTLVERQVVQDSVR